LIVKTIGVLEHSQTDLNKPPASFYREGEKYTQKTEKNRNIVCVAFFMSRFCQRVALFLTFFSGRFYHKRGRKNENKEAVRFSAYRGPGRLVFCRPGGAKAFS